MAATDSAHPRGTSGGRRAHKVSEVDSPRGMFGKHSPRAAGEPDGTPAQASSATSAGQMTIRFDSIRRPGCYVCHWNGHLLRVPPDMVGLAARPVHFHRGAEPMLVTHISDDPELPVSQARELAVRFDLSASF